MQRRAGPGCDLESRKARTRASIASEELRVSSARTRPPPATSLSTTNPSSSQIPTLATLERRRYSRESDTATRGEDSRWLSSDCNVCPAANSRARIVWCVYVRVPAWQVEPPGPCPGLRPTHGGYAIRDSTNPYPSLSLCLYLSTYYYYEAGQALASEAA